MATIEDYRNRFKQMANEFKPMIEEELRSSDIPYYIREQLYSGIDGDGKELSPSYLDDPYFRESTKTEKAAIAKAKNYVKYKMRETPPLPSRIGFSARKSTVPNLIIRGDFYESIISNVDNWSIKTGTYGTTFGNDVERKYGSQIFKLSDEARSEIIKDILRPAISQHFKKYGL